MVLALRAQLTAGPTIQRYTGGDHRSRRTGLSAGGDVRALYDLGKASRHDEALPVLARISLNAAIKGIASLTLP
jgi:hypothetical protein